MNKAKPEGVREKMMEGGVRQENSLGCPIGMAEHRVKLASRNKVLSTLWVSAELDLRVRTPESNYIQIFVTERISVPRLGPCARIVTRS